MNPAGQPPKFKLSQQAASYLKRLDFKIKQRINEGLIDAAKDPIGASNHLINRGPERSIRIGGLRILFRSEAEGIIAIDAILPRGDVYKHTRR